MLALVSSTSSTTRKDSPSILIKPLNFADFTVSKINSEQSASNLLNQTLKIGADDADAYRFMTLNGTNIDVRTVNQYGAAIKAGYSAETTFDITMESWFIQADGVLRFMERAKPSKFSLFKTKDLELLPLSVLNWTEGEEGNWLKNEAANGMTLKDCTKSNAHHPVHNLRIHGDTTTFSDDGCDYVVEELARGDVDCDGYEDLLIMISTYYQSGSGRSYQVVVVSKTHPHQRQLKLEPGDTRPANPLFMQSFH